MTSFLQPYRTSKPVQSVTFQLNPCLFIHFIQDMFWERIGSHCRNIRLLYTYSHNQNFNTSANLQATCCQLLMRCKNNSQEDTTSTTKLWRAYNCYSQQTALTLHVLNIAAYIHGHMCRQYNYLHDYIVIIVDTINSGDKT